MKSRGAEIIECPSDYPFMPFRSFLYTPEELHEVDANILFLPFPYFILLLIFSYYCFYYCLLLTTTRILSFFFANENTSDILTSSMMAMHDQSIKTALLK